MDFEAYLLFIFCVSCEAFGQLCFKASSRYFALHKSDEQTNAIMRYIAHLNVYFFAAGLFFFLEWGCWIVFLSLTTLSVATLLSSANIFVVIILSHVIYHEKLTHSKLLASLFIIFGIALVSWT